MKGRRMSSGIPRHARKALAAGIAVVLAASFLSACDGDSSTTRSSTTRSSTTASDPQVPTVNAKTLEAGQLTVGSDVPYAPFEFGDPPYIGFDVDLVGEIAKNLGLNSVFQPAPFSSLLRQTARGKFDLAAAAITITPRRERTVAFSTPYLAANQALVVKPGSSIKSLKGLKGKVVGVQRGSIGADVAKQRIDAKRVRVFATIDAAFSAVLAGDIDATIADFPVAAYAGTTRPELEVVQKLSTGEQYGLAFPKSSKRLRGLVNQQLEAMAKDGSYSAIYKKWFKSNPPSSTLKQLKAG